MGRHLDHDLLYPYCRCIILQCSPIPLLWMLYSLLCSAVYSGAHPGQGRGKNPRYGGDRSSRMDPGKRTSFRVYLVRESRIECGYGLAQSHPFAYTVSPSFEPVTSPPAVIRE